MTPYDPFQHHRRSIRIKGNDYTRAGIYFVTMVTHNREDLFGDVVDGQTQSRRASGMVRRTA